jgi:general secretion pathway protein F
MPRYRYRAYDQSGALTKGEIETRSREMALTLLHQRGAHPLEVVEDSAAPTTQRWWEREVFAGGGLPVSGLALLTRELATLVKADLQLDDALRIVSLQPLIPGRIRRVTQQLHEAVRGGESLSNALAARGTEFPEYFWRLVQAGETSGTLGDVLEDIAAFLERSSEVKSQVGSALLYPAVLLIAAVGALVIIMTVLLPTVVPLFKDAGATPPATIQFLVTMQDLLARNWMLALAALGAAIVGGGLALRQPPVRAAIDRLVLKIPVVGRLVTARETARFSRTLSTLTRNGVPMLESVRIAGSVLQNTAFKAAANDAVESLKSGETLSAPLLRCGLFSELSLRLIAVGEQTGQLDVMLMRVATVFETALQRQLARLMSLLTPILTLVIGGLVGGLILSVMTAILSVNDLAFTGAASTPAVETVQEVRRP